MATILVVIGDEAAASPLTGAMRLEGYYVSTVSTAEDALALLQSEPYDVVVIDLEAPGLIGMEMVRAAADCQPELRIILMTGRGTMESAIQAIHYHVHDYLLKPVFAQQVLDSIHNALDELRRWRVMGRGGEEQATDYPAAERLPGGAVLAWDRREITWDGSHVSLTPTETRLLRILFEHRNEVVTHTELVYRIQGYRMGDEGAAKILRPVISRLRQKLASVPHWNDRIRNIRALGYVLELR